MGWGVGGVLQPDPLQTVTQCGFPLIGPHMAGGGGEYSQMLNVAFE